MAKSSTLERSLASFTSTASRKENVVASLVNLAMSIDLQQSRTDRLQVQYRYMLRFFQTQFILCFEHSLVLDKIRFCAKPTAKNTAPDGSAGRIHVRAQRTTGPSGRSRFVMHLGVEQRTLCRGRRTT